ncbi:MAG: hypothetical protein RBU37_09975 [Myxococcota bacterium]|jgi:hypothetical protein|nr:hypothetical protein [Myxococcota bacterium]
MSTRSSLPVGWSAEPTNSNAIVIENGLCGGNESEITCEPLREHAQHRVRASLVKVPNGIDAKGERIETRLLVHAFSEIPEAP